MREQAGDLPTYLPTCLPACLAAIMPPTSVPCLLSAALPSPLVPPFPLFRSGARWPSPACRLCPHCRQQAYGGAGRGKKRRRRT